MRKQKIYLALNENYFTIDKDTDSTDVLDQIKNYSKINLADNLIGINPLQYNTDLDLLKEELENDRQEYVRTKLNENNIFEYSGLVEELRNPDYKTAIKKFEKEYGKHHILELEMKHLRKLF